MKNGLIGIEIFILN